MLRVIQNGVTVDVPIEIEAQGPGAVEAYVAARAGEKGAPLPPPPPVEPAITADPEE